MNRLALLVSLTSISIAVAADSPSDCKAIIDRAVQARGGADKLAKFNTMSWTANGTFYGMGNEMPYSATYAAEWPGKYRMEIKDFMTVILNGDKAWRIQGDSTDELDKDQLAGTQQGVFASWVADHLQVSGEGVSCSVKPEAKVDDKPADVVVVSRSGHSDVTLYFDKGSGLLVKRETMVKDPQEDKLVKEEASYSDYKEFDGVKWPTTVSIRRNGEPYVKATYTDIKPSPKIDPKTFEKP
jgi:outer membrane lipoprotein-sorting protein